MTGKTIVKLVIMLMIAMVSIVMSTEKRTHGTTINQKPETGKLINFESRDLVPSGRWKWRSRWQVGTPTQWELYDGDKNRAGKWIMPWARTGERADSSVRYRGYYNSRIPYAPREHWNRYQNFRPGHYFNRFKQQQHYYPFGYFYRHNYHRYFNSFWSYPSWAWNWYPRWWMAYDYPYSPGYYYHNSWYPRRYDYPGDAYHNKYYARIATTIEPEDTLVYIDNEMIGTAKEHNGWWLTAPVKAGKHQVVLKRQGYETFSMDFEVAPGQYYRLEHRMQNLTGSQRESEASYLQKGIIENQSGRLMLNVQPSNATVYIDSIFVGTYQDLMQKNNKINLESGKHFITIVSPTYIPYNAEFEINTQQDTQLKAILTPRKSM